ncbi:host cell division inhibitor Icd-like protein [Klebsiella pneumoniae]|uniref:host cell division inhibitor Icd-like protein n=2 Tax=Klebsiella pneumoniae TaxID=573 RepID=UPI00350E45EE
MSCGTRAAIVCDLRLIAFVAMLFRSPKGVGQYGLNKKSVQHLTCSTPLLKLVFNTLCCLNTDTAKPGSVTSTNRASYHKPLFEVTVMAVNQSTQTRPKFTWRFLALNRHDKKSRPCRLSVEAATESEASSILAPHFILSLAARLPASEVRHG